MLAVRIAILNGMPTTIQSENDKLWDRLKPGEVYKLDDANPNVPYWARGAYIRPYYRRRVNGVKTIFCTEVIH